MELRILATLASVAAAAITSRGGGAVAQRSLSAAHSQSLVVAGQKPVSFGDTRCPCIGFDNIDGETTIVFENNDGKVTDEVAYPADLGSRCEAWDNRRHTSCAKGSKEKWCQESWCYVDPCDCKIPVLPKVSEYTPDARYRGKPLFFSYATCGGKDTWTKGVPEVGTPGCRCINFDNMPGTTEMAIMGKSVAYPAEVGGSCQTWDKETHPLCKADKPPKWCFQNWCYVDPCSCSLPNDVIPKVSNYLPEATFTGKSIYYSYETCGGKDTYTEEHNKKACVNQKNEEDCNALDRCAWAGSSCMGAELVDHPLCEGVVTDYEDKGGDDDEGKKSGAAAAVPAVLSAALALVPFARA